MCLNELAINKLDGQRPNTSLAFRSITSGSNGLVIYTSAPTSWPF